MGKAQKSFFLLSLCSRRRDPRECLVQVRPLARVLRGMCGLQIQEEADEPYVGRYTPRLVREPEIPWGGRLLLFSVSAVALWEEMQLQPQWELSPETTWPLSVLSMPQPTAGEPAGRVQPTVASGRSKPFLLI